MQYAIRKTDSAEDAAKIVSLRNYLKWKGFKHWSSSTTTGLSQYKRDHESGPTLELQFHSDATRECEYAKLKAELKLK